ncbi:MAG: MFS transporter [Beijerinckiaceae bacterium]
MNRLLPILALVSGSGFLMFAGGINGLILPLRGSIEGFSSISLGLLGAAWAVGYVAGCLLVPHLVRRVGHIRTFSTLAALAAISVLGSLLAIHSAAWIPLRLICGFCFSGAAMIVESWLNESTGATSRGRVFGVYMMVNLFATTLGNLAIMTGDRAGYTLFVVAAIFYCLALLPTALSSTRAPAPLVQAHLNLRELWTNSPYAVVAIVLVGVSNGAYGTLAAVYAERSELNLTAIAIFMALALLAGALFQIPVGYLSERFDRRRVLTGLAILAGAVDLFFIATHPTDVLRILIAGGIFGGAIYSMYPVIVAHANDRAAPDTFLQVSGGLLLLFGAGAIAGPAIAGVIMMFYGPAGLFVTTFVAHAGIVAYGLRRVSARSESAHELKTGFVTVLPARLATPESAVLDPRTSETEMPSVESGKP